MFLYIFRVPQLSRSNSVLPNSAVVYNRYSLRAENVRVFFFSRPAPRKAYKLRD